MEDAPARFQRPPRLSTRKIVATGASLVLVGALLAFALPWATGASWPQIFAALSRLPWWVPALMVVGAITVLMCEAGTISVATAGLSYRRALHAHACANALLLAVPGGGAVGFGVMGWLFRRAGIAVITAMVAIAIASAIDTAVSFLLLPLVGLAAYALAALGGSTQAALPGGWWAVLVALALVGISVALIGFMLSRRGITTVLNAGEMLYPQLAEHREAVMDARDAAMVRARSRMFALFAPVVAARAIQLGLFALALWAVGAEVSALLVVAFFALSRLLSLIPITPGGTGVTETVAGAALVAVGVQASAAAAAMLVFMVATVVVPVIVGALAGAVIPPAVTDAQSSES